MLFPYIVSEDDELLRDGLLTGLYRRMHGARLIWEMNGGFKSAEASFSMPRSSAYEFYERYLGKRIFFTDGLVDLPVIDGYLTSIEVTGEGVACIVSGHWFRHSDQLYNFDDLAKITELGALSYTTEGADSSFTDDGQTFTPYASSGGVAVYELWVINDDNTISWGFIDTVVSTTEIAIFQDYTLTTTGWNGEGDVTTKTPLSYQVILCYDYKTTSEILIDALGSVEYISGDTSNIAETSTVIAYWEPPIEEGGMYPAEVIDKMASMSDSEYRQWNYWLTNRPLYGGLPQAPVAHFQPQVNDGSFDWAIRMSMLKTDASLEHNIQELRNRVRVAYKDMDTGTLTLEPADATFIEDTNSRNKYWDREAILSGGDSDTDLAQQYGNLYLSKYKDAVFSNAFVVSSPWILDAGHNRVPLWYPIKYGKSYFKFVDLEPNQRLDASSLDRKRVSQAMMMEYTADTNSLRVVLDSEDNRVDAMLARVDAFR